MFAIINNKTATRENIKKDKKFTSYNSTICSSRKSVLIILEEGIEGVINRAKNARSKYSDADYYVGMEGYVDTNKYGMFLAGVVAIMDKHGEIGVGISVKMQLPMFIQKKIQDGEELGPLVKDLMNDTDGNIRQFDGTNGILSKGLYNRVDEFKDTTNCALARFQSPEFFNKK